MNYDEILRKILRRYGNMTENIRALQIVESKLKRSVATYADAQNYAIAIGTALKEVFSEYLPEALTDGRLYRAFADVLVKTPMERTAQDVAKVAAAVQEGLNEAAGIGLKAIIPELNQDQITGIITGIVNADSYEGNVELFLDQVAGFFEGQVDDFAGRNAEFQYEAGLSPTIQRIADAKCCSWCLSLAGTYNYRDVADKGNDVWRRHNNCHCQILFNPAGSKRRR